MSLASIQTSAFISYCSPVQGRMAGASTSVYKFNNVVRGQHVYKSAWTTFTDKMVCKYILWEDNKHDKYAVNNRLYWHQKEDAHIKRDIENKLIFHNVWH